MATYINNLRLKEITTGDEDGTWGTSTNTNLELITDGFSYGTKEIAADANETFTMPDATTDATRSLYLKFTSAVDLTATREITLGPNTVSKTWIIENATTGGQIITIKQGSGATVNVPNGSKVMIVTDGAGAGAAVFNANPTEVGGTVTSVGGTGTVNGLTLTGTVTTSGNLTLGGTLANVDLTSQVTGTLPIANGGTGSTSTTYVDLTTNVTGTLPVANGGTGVTSSTGTGSVVLSTSPTFTTPNLGTPSAVTLTNATGLPIVAGTTGTLSVARGGTGSTTASGALTNLGLTATAAEINTLDGITATTTELNYTDGVTSNIQTQLNAKGVGSVTSVGGTGTVDGLTLSGTVTSSGDLTLSGSVSIDNTNWSGTDLSLANGGTGASLVDPNADRIFFWDDSAGSTAFLTVGSGLQISGTTLSSTDAGGTVTSVAVSGGTTGLTTSGGPITGSGTITLAGTLAIANGGTGSTTASGALTSLGLTATAAEINVLDGITATTTELNYTDGVTSNIQTQLNAKGVGSVTSVGGTGTVQGLTLSGTVTSSGNLTLGGSLADVDLTSQVTGTLPVANGGTGATTLTANNVILGNGTSAVQAVAPGTSGNVLTSNGTTWTSAAAPAGLTGVTDSASPRLTALGSGAAAGNTATALDNTVVGFSSLCTNSLGDRNTVFGACNLQVATSCENIAIGVCNANSLTTASCTIAIGFRALENNTTGLQNIAIGRCALFCNTVGNNAIAIGHRALYNSCIPFQFNNNVAVGDSALCFVTTGCHNVGLGSNAGGRVSTGSYNIALGQSALGGSGSCIGGCNIGIGVDAGSSCLAGNKSGSNNIVIGLNAGFFMYNSSCPYRGYVDVGTPTVLCNHIILGNIAHTCAMVPVGWTTVSDCRDKTCFKEVPHGIDFVRALKPTEYQFRKKRDLDEPDGVKRYGFLAQDIIALEGESPVVASATDPDTLKYTESHMVPILVNAIKDLADEIEKIKDLINKM